MFQGIEPGVRILVFCGLKEDFRSLIETMSVQVEKMGSEVARHSRESKT
jgi:hypothetical protein